VNSSGISVDATITTAVFTTSTTIQSLEQLDQFWSKTSSQDSVAETGAINARLRLKLQNFVGSDHTKQSRTI